MGRLGRPRLRSPRSGGRPEVQANRGSIRKERAPVQHPKWVFFIIKIRACFILHPRHPSKDIIEGLEEPQWLERFIH
jgi:hypothetical protein